MNVTCPQLCRETVCFSVEKQQGVIARGLEVPVVGTLLLLTVDRNLGRVQVQHRPLWRVDGFCFRNQCTIDLCQTGQILLSRQQFGLGLQA